MLYCWSSDIFMEKKIWCSKVLIYISPWEYFLHWQKPVTNYFYTRIFFFFFFIDWLNEKELQRALLILDQIHFNICNIYNWTGSGYKKHISYKDMKNHWWNDRNEQIAQQCINQIRCKWKCQPFIFRSL